MVAGADRPRKAERVLKCHLCSKIFHQIWALKEHYVLAHFRTKLFDRFLLDSCQEEEKCPFCHVKDVPNVIAVHIGIRHNRLGDFLPPSIWKWLKVGRNALSSATTGEPAARQPFGERRVARNVSVSLERMRMPPSRRRDGGQQRSPSEPVSPMSSNATASSPGSSSSTASVPDSPRLFIATSPGSSAASTPPLFIAPSPASSAASPISIAASVAAASPCSTAISVAFSRSSSGVSSRGASETSSSPQIAVRSKEVKRWKGKQVLSRDESAGIGLPVPVEPAAAVSSAAAAGVTGRPAGMKKNPKGKSDEKKKEKKEDRSLEKQNKEKRSSKTGAADKNGGSGRPGEPAKTAIRFACRLCPTQVDSRSQLVAHYASTALHAVPHLRQRFGLSLTDTTCPICQVVFGRKKTLYQHLGRLHVDMRDYMPEEDWGLITPVKRSKRRSPPPIQTVKPLVSWAHGGSSTPQQEEEGQMNAATRFEGAQEDSSRQRSGSYTPAGVSEGKQV